MLYFDKPLVMDGEMAYGLGSGNCLPCGLVTLPTRVLFYWVMHEAWEWAVISLKEHLVSSSNEI